MREIKTWHRGLRQTVQKAWGPEGVGRPSERLCEVELGLYAWEILMPQEKPQGLWVALTGYTPTSLVKLGWNHRQLRTYGVIRHLLPYYRGPYGWEEDLEWYATLPEYIRGYEIDHDYAQRLEPSIATNRFDIYERTIAIPPAITRRQLKPAEAGNYVFEYERRPQDVSIPEEWIAETKDEHDLTPKPARKPLTVSWKELQETAAWMDEWVEEENYSSRLANVRLEIWQGDRLKQTDELNIDGLLHLAGMLSSGKTTLMQVLTVWAVHNEYHVTLILGDVLAVLEWTSLLERMQIQAAPIIGSYSRERHLNRLHRVEADEYPNGGLQLHHPAFKWLGTSCALNGSLKTPIALEPNKLPCTRLQKPDELDTQPSKFYGCPLYSRCNVHHANKTAVDAQVWVATSASMVYTRVPVQINRESMRMGELVSRRSDLVLVDEADRVQTQLDTTFSPSEILAGSGGDPWLNQLSGAVQDHLRRQGRGNFGLPHIESWIGVQRQTQLATDRLYALFIREANRLENLNHDYFTGWTLWEKLITDILGLQDMTNAEKKGHPQYQAQMKVFNAFSDSPLPSSSTINEEQLVARLRGHSNHLLLAQSINEVYPILRGELEQLFTDVDADDDQWDRWAKRFAFALLASVLSWGVNYLTSRWEQIKRPLDMDSYSSSLFYNPPKDYDAVMPVAPMGNVLAFQYTAADDGESGVLRFFRVAGVGRAWLLNLHQLFVAEDAPGPHVVLLSGTSWAGASPLYHIQHPVDGVLRAPDRDVEAIAEHSRFIQSWVYDEDTKRHIHVSGSYGGSRITAFDKLAKHFTERTGPTRSGPSLLEQERDRLPDKRQRLLILVGSYAEAKYVRQAIVRNRPTWEGQVLSLVRDDESLVDDWGREQGTLQRGQVSRFAQHEEAWILIAPLLAVERGHNIILESGHAAIGAAYFWVRPHPRPDDLTLPIAAINAWAIEHGNGDWGNTVQEAGEKFRKVAYAKWREWLQMPWIYSTLPDDERDMVTWTQLVTIWQVVGRLVRKGSPARVHFVDAAFRSRFQLDEDEETDDEILQTGLLAEMQRVLAPYFDPSSSIDPGLRELVKTLYMPFYKALETLKEV